MKKSDDNDIEMAVMIIMVMNDGENDILLAMS